MSNMLGWLKDYLKSTPQEELRKEWEEIEGMGFTGPNAFEYLKALDSIYSVQLKEYCPPDKLVCAKDKKNMTPNFSESFFLCNLAL